MKTLNINYKPEFNEGIIPLDKKLEIVMESAIRLFPQTVLNKKDLIEFLAYVFVVLLKFDSIFFKSLSIKYSHNDEYTNYTPKELLSIIKEVYYLAINKINLLKRCKNLGLARPEYLQHGYGYDVIRANGIIQDIAYDLGLDPEKIYDSEGYYGLDHAKIARAWFGSKCGNIPTFIMWVNKSLLPRVNGKGIALNIPAPEKKMSVDNYKHYLKGISVLDKYTKFYYKKFNYNSMIKLGKLNYLTRVYLVKNAIVKKSVTLINIDDESMDASLSRFMIQNNLNNDEALIYAKSKGYSIYRVVSYRIDFNAYKNIKGLSKIDLIKKVGLNQKDLWYTLIGRLPKGFVYIDDLDVISITTNKVVFKTFRNILDKTISEGMEPENAYNAAVRLSLLFKDMGTLNRWLKINDNNIHNAAQFTLVDTTKLENNWGDLVVKFPELQWEVSKFKLFENKRGKFTTITAFRGFALTVVYKIDMPEDIAILGAKYKVSENNIKKYIRFFDRAGVVKQEDIPHVKISKGDYTLEKLDKFDKEGPFLGLATDCCQHLDNAGSSCAKAGYSLPSSGFYVIRKNGTIIAQSWVWRSTNDELVLDSIEAKGGVNVDIISELLSDMKKYINTNYCLGINKVFIGDTNYGITKKVKSILGGKKASYVPEMDFMYGGYTDATRVWEL